MTKTVTTSEKGTRMRVRVTRDTTTLARAGASGNYTIDSVIHADTDEDLTNRIDTERVFHEDDETEPLEYLRTVFGQSIELVKDDSIYHPDWPFK